MYDAYTANTNPILKKLVENNPSLYDSIARSSYASNNRNGFGQTFFNYVIESQKGAGLWLQQNTNINIRDIDDIDNLTGLFTLSDGWCSGVEAAHICYNHNTCISKGTTIDYIAAMLHKNPTAVSYILGNPATKEAYGADDKSGWRNRYRIKHTKYSGTPTDTVDVIAGTSYDNPQSASVSYNGYTSVYREIISYGTGIVNSNAFMLNTQQITVYAYFSNHQRFAQTFTWSCMSGGKNISDKVILLSEFVDAGSCVCRSASGNYDLGACLKAFTFDVSRLSAEEMKNASLQVSLSCKNDILANGSGNVGHKETYVIHASCGILPKVTLTNSIDDCDLNGHDWKGTMTLSEDKSHGTINYECNKNRGHFFSETVKTTVRQDNDSTTYTCNGTYESYSKRFDLQTGSSGTKTIKLDANNTTGQLQVNTSSDERIYPAGSLSTYTYKKAFATISCQINPDVIKKGAKSIKLNINASDTLTDLSIKVMSARGKELSKNNWLTSADSAYVDLTYCSDSDLEHCYVIITGQACTMNKETFTRYGGPNPKTAHANISGESITVNY